jgi:acylphosphatase
MARRIRAIVTGRVQGVSYRASAAREAQRLGLVGWVRNTADGAVELEAEGPSASVDTFVAWCHRGPAAARVSGVAVEERAAMAEEAEFEIRYGM